MFNECLDIRRKIAIFSIFPSKINFFRSTIKHHQIKHLEVRQIYSAAGRRTFNLLRVSCNISNMRCSVSSLQMKHREES